MLKTLGAVMLLLSLAACAGAPNRPEITATGGVEPASLAAAADLAREEGRFADAMTLYQRVLVADQKAVASQYGMAECLLALGRAGEARPIFATLVADANFHARALQGGGLALLVLERREQAASLLRDAVASDPKSWRALNGLGMLADLKHQPGEAQAFYEKALALNPNSAMLINNRGYSRLMEGKPEEAAADFRAALALDPGSETIEGNLRIAIASRGAYAEALRGVPREKLSAAQNNVGFIAMRRGDLAAAENLLNRAMTDSPSYETVAAKNLDQVSAMEGKPQ